MMKSRSLSKLLAAMMVVALLVMALPMTILAEPPAHAKANRDRALGRDKVKVEDVEEEEPSEEEEEMSWRAEFVHARNEWAKSVDEAGKMRIPPGHANLMLKYLMSLPVEPDVVPDEGAEMSLFDSYKEGLEALLADFYNVDTGRFDVKAFKEFAQMPDEDESEPEITVA